MRKSEGVLLALALTALFAGGIGAAAAATPGYSIYEVQFTSPGHTYSLTANETVAATSSATTDDLILSVVAQGWNSSYSRSINASSQVSPFLPSITNQSLNFGSGSTMVSVGIKYNGTTPLQFSGRSYTLDSYSLTATGSDNGTSVTVSGALTTFPSGLIYSASLTTSGLGVPSTMLSALGYNSTGATLGSGALMVKLLSTSLPLDASTPSTAAQAASIGVGAGAAITAVALGLGVRRHSKHKAQLPEEKPQHWVD